MSALVKAVVAGAKESSAVLLLETQTRAGNEAKAVAEWLRSKGLDGQFEAALPKVAASLKGRMAANDRFAQRLAEAKKAAEEAANKAAEEAAARAEAEAAETASAEGGAEL